MWRAYDQTDRLSKFCRNLFKFSIKNPQRYIQKYTENNQVVLSYSYLLTKVYWLKTQRRCHRSRCSLIHRHLVPLNDFRFRFHSWYSVSDTSSGLHKSLRSCCGHSSLLQESKVQWWAIHFQDIYIYSVITLTDSVSDLPLPCPVNKIVYVSSNVLSQTFKK